MKRNFLTLVILVCSFFAVNGFAEIQETKKPSNRETLMSSLLVNIKQSAPLIAYGILGACSGANMAVSSPDKLIKVPGTTAVFHWGWTLGIFALSTAGKVMECESGRTTGILSETAINVGFTGIILATGYLTSLPVALGVTAAFVSARILHSGDKSPLEHIKPSAS